MIRRPFLIVTVIAVAAVLAAVGALVAIRRAAPAASGSRGHVPVQVSLGAATSQAARISLGGKTYPLSPGPAGTRQGRIDMTAGTGGVAVARDAVGQVVGSAPVWAVPGQPARAAEMTCRSTAFDEFLLTPGVAGPDPVGVDVLWAMAARGRTGSDVTALGRLICAGWAGQPSPLAHPTPAEIAAYGRMYRDYAAALHPLADELPSLSSSVSGIRASLAAAPAGPGAAPAIRLAAAFTPARAGGACPDGAGPVTSDSGSITPLSLCTDGRTIDAENNSAAWAFLYGTPSGPGHAAGLPPVPAAVVPGRTSDFPSLEKITGAVIHDYIAGKARAGCIAASWVNLCKVGKAPHSALSALSNLVEAGRASTTAAAGYYSIAWGDGHGDQNTFPASASSTAENGVVADSVNLTFITSVVAPTIGLLLDRQLKLNLDPDQLPLLLPVFTDLAGSALGDAAKGVPATTSGRLHAVIDTAKDLFARPVLLGDVAEAFIPGLKDLSAQLAKQLGEYLAGLEIPVAGWAALLVKAVGEGSAAITLALSIAGMFQALTEPSYSSWPAMLTAAAAFTLPVTALGMAPSCPAPAAPVAIPPGAPGKPACEWVVSADLDGNGRADRLVTWLTQGQRGAVAFLDDGSIHPLRYPPSALANSTLPWSTVTPGVGDTNEPAETFRLTSSARQQVLLIGNIGAVGDRAAVIGLAADGNLRLAAGQQGQVQDVLTARDLGCATQSGQRVFVESALGRGEPGVSGGPAPGYGISRSYYVVSPDLRIRFTGYQGSVVRLSQPRTRSATTAPPQSPQPPPPARAPAPPPGRWPAC